MGIIVMNFSHAYEKQDFYRERDISARMIDCTDIQGTNCYCDEEAERSINARMGSLGPGGIHFLDSGNYHYLSKIWLDRIQEPFDLLVFDHHTDMQPPMFGDILSCGGWIKAALEGNPYLNHVWLAGPPQQAAAELKEQRLTWVGEDAMRDRKGWKLLFSAEEPGQASPLPLYISVDKDVLRRKDARTNWDQGETELETILACIRDAACIRPIIGMDVCGENPEGMDGPDAGEELRVNNRTNGLLAACLAGYLREGGRR